MNVTTVSSKVTLGGIQLFTVAGDDTLRVEHDDVFVGSTQSFVQLGTRDGCCTGTVYHNLHVFNLLACHFEGIQETGCRDDGGAVLVVVHHGDVEFFLKATFNLKALWSLDILEVDTSEGWGNGFDGLDELFRVFLIDLDVEHVDAGIYLEKQTFTLHHRLGGMSTDVTQTQHSCIERNEDGVALTQVAIVGRAGQAEIWDAEEFRSFEAENLTPEKLLASLEAIGL